MSGECAKCGEHCLECVCDDETLTTCSEFPIGLAASMIRRNLEETQLMIAFQGLQEVGMCEECEKCGMNCLDCKCKQKKRCKYCSQFYEVNLSIHVCDECFPKCVSYEPIRAKPK